ncbi:3'-5' exonuclease [Tropicimonas sp. TH_r6]|uniref:3'-5' exonuclease n=1 Tax=Tropicimonas sp. TH_r6 TaxID=3082085 RepID=UPI002953C3B1|nr:3'-5' exonuclease [Tropicimonas sp. TH_r6]MDV7145648.1 3'-5' exonuclease [Tropicimonas sp. TH_r6]
MTFRIADTFSDSLAKLAAQEQKAVKTAAFDLQMNPASPGLSMHRVDRARDPDFWTARVNRDIRLVLHKRDGATLLAWVGHHDDAYKWAETRRIDTHPRTGAAQIVQIRETVEEVVIQRYVEEAVRLPRLFASESDDTLLSWGVPADWLDTVRDATDETVLEIAGHLPSEAGESLLQAATGVRPDQAPIVEPGSDPFAHPDAGRRFRTMENVDELRAALDAPWERWSVYLHPAQREYVDRDFNGPARVIGSAGTGKTVVALHRAVRMAQAPEARVLLTTFNERLAYRLAEKLPLLAGAEVCARIETAALQSCIVDLHAKKFGERHLASDEEIARMLEDAAATFDLHVSPDFLADEWKLIVDAWDVSDGNTYRDLPRLGRKVRMATKRRDALWQVFDAVLAELDTRGWVTEASLAHDLRKASAFPFTHAVVDEAQDISVAQLRLLGETLGDAPNGLFFAGDIGQRIFRPPFPWTAAGVELRGRSRSLKVNYRTSHQIRRQTEGLLPETLVEADGAEEKRLGVTSVFDGPAPLIRTFETREQEIDELRAWISARLSEGCDPDAIAVLVRDRSKAVEVSDELEADLTIMTMHDAKGAEFRAVAVIALDHSAIPNEQRLMAAQDEAQLDEVMATERHLLYVAATRARDFLWMSGVEPVSEFLNDLGQTADDVSAQ